MRQLELHTAAGAHLRIHELTGLGPHGLNRVALAIDCREFDDGAVWVSLTEAEANAVAEALVGANTVV
jgi:hypothetical protein